MQKAILHEEDGTTFNVEVVKTYYDPETHIKYAEVKPLDFKMFNREVPYKNLEILKEFKEIKESFGGELKENYDYTKIDEKPKSKSR